jgi:Fic family protein
MPDTKPISTYQSGKWARQFQYQSFSPTAINCQWGVDIPEIQTLSDEAHGYLGELNAYSRLIPDVDYFIKMHIAKEATTSSRIEGTQTNIEDAFLDKEDIQPEKRDDWQEVQNYIEAMNVTIRELERLPLSNRLIRSTHQHLMQGVRGEQKLPGEFRTSQNWIGGATLKDAVFVPPHHTEVQDLMADLEKFLHNDEIYVSDIIRIAIAHYQFETIHPFLDGNGRIGRLLVTLYLVGKNRLSKPTLYLSDFFEKNKSLYYDNLTRVRTHNDLTHWLKFFLVGVIETSKNSIQTFQDIISLKEHIEKNILPRMGKKAPVTRKLIDRLYQQPVTNPGRIEKQLGISKPSANSLLRNLEELGVVRELTGFKRNRVFAFWEYMEIFHK